MKLVMLSMISIGICCGNSYAMDPYATSKKLSQAVRYIKQGQEALQEHQRERNINSFLGIHCKQDDKFIIDFVNQAKTLTQQIIGDKTASPHVRQKAREYFDEASSLINSFNNKNK